VIFRGNAEIRHFSWLIARGRPTNFMCLVVADGDEALQDPTKYCCPEWRRLLSITAQSIAFSAEQPHHYRSVSFGSSSHRPSYLTLEEVVMGKTARPFFARGVSVSCPHRDLDEWFG